ncbi:MAG TPA: PQQ-binding-like beta-propeller repeat protein [Lacipirellulaceae bacterium]|jgi:outer membrane protein assembly factor BamB|nr:PQQ-binding-like beta-propeller repeat protein [Lacipirellulaceae bacterium]
MKKPAILVVTGICIVAAVIYAASNSRQHAFTFATTAAAASSVAEEREEPAASPATKDWPQWRGPNRDAVSTEKGLLQDWPEDGPPLLWTAKGLGRGMSSVSVDDGRILTMGNLGKGVHLIALNAENGERIWAAPLDGDGEPNGTPTIDGEHVFAIERGGTLVCAETATGRLVWQKNFVKEFGGKVPSWGYSESPLVDGDVVVCTPGARQALIVALNKSSGDAVWKATAPAEMAGRGHGGAGYSSVVIGHGAGIRQYVQLVGNGVIGVTAADGTPLWGYNRIANDVANIPTPIVHEDYVLAATGYGAGAALLRLERADNGVKVNEVYFHRGNKMQNHHGGMVLVDDHVYLGHGHNQGLPMCVELLTGKIAWGPVRGPGEESAAVLYADGHLYFRYQNAVMALIEATPQEYRLKASFKLPSNLDNSWPHPVIANGRLYLRDQDVLMCYDLRRKSDTDVNPIN